MGTLEQKWGPNGDPKTEKGPHGDRVPQMGTHLGAVLMLDKYHLMVGKKNLMIEKHLKKYLMIIRSDD